jgi:hypothetical protein
MKTSELTRHALNWAVSQVEGIDHDTAILNITIGDDNGWFLDYLTWEQGGPIIERELIEIYPLCNVEWGARKVNDEGDLMRFYGDTPLIAAMRCYVASKLGDEVEIPTELTQGEVNED